MDSATMRQDLFDAAVKVALMPNNLKELATIEQSRETDYSIILCSRDGKVLARVKKDRARREALLPKRKSSSMGPKNGLRESRELNIPHYASENLWFYKELEDRGYRFVPDSSTDRIVYAFLRLHDVDVAPPSGSMQLGPGARAFYGAAGPGAYAAAEHLHNQRKAVEIQEWTSWKQWALSHKDWQDFKDRTLECEQAANRRFHQFISSDEGNAIAKEIVLRHHEILESNNRSRLKMMIMFLVCIALLIGITKIAFNRDVRYEDKNSSGYTYPEHQ
jgi:hypothetical protein